MNTTAPLPDKPELLLSFLDNMDHVLKYNTPKRNEENNSCICKCHCHDAKVLRLQGHCYVVAREFCMVARMFWDCSQIWLRSLLQCKFKVSLTGMNGKLSFGLQGMLPEVSLTFWQGYEKRFFQ